MSAFIKAAKSETAKQCSVAKARERLGDIDPDSARDFDAWMVGEEVKDDDGKIVKLTDVQVWNSLQGLGFRVGQQTVGRHRRAVGECGCRP